jgi:hypothetical protein
MAALILNPGYLVRFMLRPLYSRKDPSLPITRSVCHRDGLDVSEKREKDLFLLPTFERDACTLQLILCVLCWPFRCYS